jgi:L-ascorbate metabolism protein UlaG (beta-lactamase superfamily)
MTQIFYYGHSCFEVVINKKRILFDPYITANKRAESKVQLKFLKPDYILVTHGHEDHTLDVEMLAKQSDARIIANYEIAMRYQKKGLDKAVPMNHGGIIKLAEGITVKMVNAVHTSSFPDGTYAGQPAGFVVRWDKGSFYYSGDTALHYDMKLIGEDGGVDFAFLCVGNHFTMGLEDAAKAAEFVKAEKVFAMHFDTFPFIKIDKDTAHIPFAKKGIKLVIPEIGEDYEA